MICDIFHSMFYCVACTVYDQSANICIQGYLRIFWIRNTKSSNIDEFINVMFHVLNRSISLKVVNLTPEWVLYATSGREMAL